MKKSIILKVISIVFALITILAIACAITGTGSGFLDLSNIARAVCVGVAVICGILAFMDFGAIRFCEQFLWKALENQTLELIFAYSNVCHLL